MRRQSLLFGAVGVVSTLLGVVLLVTPDAVGQVGPLAWGVDTLASVEATTLGFVAGCLAVAYLGLTARSRPAPETVSPESSTESRFEMATTAPPEAPTAQRQPVTATYAEDNITEAVEFGADALTALRAQLRVSAVAVYADATDLSRDQARTAIERGTWTDDELAAAFLAGPAGPEPSLWLRLRLWLVPARERRRRIERTLTAIEGLR